MDPITVAVSEGMQELAASVDTQLKAITNGENLAFCLVVFTPGRVGYISNAERAQVAGALAALLKNWESGLPDIPAHHYQS